MITTKSQFYYGHTISNGASGDLGNFRIDFSEGGPALVATLNAGDYSITEFTAEVKRALDAAGALTYSVSVNRTTRLITIAATGTFSLLCFTGVNQGTAVWALLGFNTGADKTGAATYLADNASGYVYRPQAILQMFEGKDDNLEKLDAVVNISASGVVQVVTFGNQRYFMFEIYPITNLTLNSCAEIDNNQSAVSDARQFFEYAITKAKMEIMTDRDTPGTFSKIILESTESSKTGTAYRLQVLAKDVYESGKIKLREITT